MQLPAPHEAINNASLYADSLHPKHKIAGAEFPNKGILIAERELG